MEDENEWSDVDGISGVNKRVTDHQFLKTIEGHGRALLNSSKKPAAIAVRKDAVQAMMHFFSEKFGVTHTENQIFKRFYNMKQRLRTKLKKKEPLTNSEQFLKNLMDEEDLKGEGSMETYEGRAASVSLDSAAEPFFCQLDCNMPVYSTPYPIDANAAELEQKVLREQHRMLEKQKEVLNLQKEVYLLKKEILLAELNEYKSHGSEDNSP